MFIRTGSDVIKVLRSYENRGYDKDVRPNYGGKFKDEFNFSLVI